MACYARFSLSALLSPLPFKRSLSSLPAALVVAKHLEWGPQAIAGAERRRTSLLRVRAMATDASPEEAVPRSVPVRVAHELLQAGHRYLDVRTVDEFSAGHPVGATNIPYMFKVGAGMMKNPNFLAKVSSAFGKDDEIIIGCQSGKRSLMAAADLSSAVSTLYDACQLKRTIRFYWSDGHFRRLFSMVTEWTPHRTVVSILQSNTFLKF